MNDKLEQRNMIMEKARNIIETGKGERLSTKEVDTLKHIGGVVFVAYQHALEFLDNKENIGGISYER